MGPWKVRVAALLAALCGACSAPSLVSYESRSAFVAGYVMALDEHMRLALIGDDAPELMAHCLLEASANRCVLARSGLLSPCVAIGCDQTQITLELNTPVFEDSRVQSVLRRDGGRLCIYRDNRPENDAVRLVSSLGCRSPGSTFELAHRYEVALCVVEVGNDGRGLGRIISYRDEREVEENWCSEVVRERYEVGI